MTRIVRSEEIPIALKYDFAERTWNAGRPASRCGWQTWTLRRSSYVEDAVAEQVRSMAFLVTATRVDSLF